MGWKGMEVSALLALVWPALKGFPGNIGKWQIPCRGWIWGVIRAGAPFRIAGNRQSA
jgi:hypothetical protein